MVPQWSMHALKEAKGQLHSPPEAVALTPSCLCLPVSHLRNGYNTSADFPREGVKAPWNIEQRRVFNDRSEKYSCTSLPLVSQTPTGHHLLLPLQRHIYLVYVLALSVSLGFSFLPKYLFTMKTYMSENFNSISEEHMLTLMHNIIRIVVVSLWAIRPSRQNLITCFPLACLSCGHFKALAQEAWQNRSAVCN